MRPWGKQVVKKTIAGLAKRIREVTTAILKMTLLYRPVVSVLRRSERLRIRLRRDIEKRYGFRGYPILSASEGNSTISQLLELHKPCAIGKLGSWETGVLTKFIRQRGRIEKLDESEKMFLYRNAGIFHPNDGVFNKFCLELLDSLKSIDFVAVWYTPNESSILKKYTKNATLAELRSLEPYYHSDPWSRLLENKRVLVLHPFEKSIRRQYQFRRKIWQDERYLPDFELDVIRVPMPEVMEATGFKDWFDVLQYLKGKMSEKEFDVAIVGAGPYSIPLVAHAKSRGKFAIHLGGGTQILFGIKGKRWDNHEIISKFYNDYWSHPLQEETPPNASIIEGGCYW